MEHEMSAVVDRSTAGASDNYSFCAAWAEVFASPNAAVLDYGCGKGQIVGLLRDRGLQGFGCDVFYEGGDYSVAIPERLQPFIRRMRDDRIPFQSASFDLVITNQVIEHVRDLALALSEMKRVLKPGGWLLSLFGHRGCWREGHCGIPFLHWFPKASQPRVYYAAALRKLGLGYHTQGKTALEWSRDFCQWLDDWTWYRSTEQLLDEYSRHFSRTRMIDREWLSFRLGGIGRLTRHLPNLFSAAVARPLAGLAIVSQK